MLVANTKFDPAIQGVPGYHINVLFNGEPEENLTNLRFLNNHRKGTFTINLKPANLGQNRISITPVYRVSNRTKSINLIPRVNGEYTFDIQIRENTELRQGYVTNSCVRFIAHNAASELCEYEISIFSQNGRHYFAMQRKWQSILVFDADGKVEVENIDWPALVEFLSKETTMQPRVKSSIDPVEAQSTVRKLGKSKGRVKYFVLSTGVGAIQTDKGDAKVHFSKIRGHDPKGPAILLPGEVVDLQIEKTPLDVESAFEFMATSVTRIMNIPTYPMKQVAATA